MVFEFEVTFKGSVNHAESVMNSPIFHPNRSYLSGNQTGNFEKWRKTPCFYKLCVSLRLVALVAPTSTLIDLLISIIWGMELSITTLLKYVVLSNGPRL